MLEEEQLDESCRVMRDIEEAIRGTVRSAAERGYRRGEGLVSACSLGIPEHPKVTRADRFLGKMQRQRERGRYQDHEQDPRRLKVEQALRKQNKGQLQVEDGQAIRSAAERGHHRPGEPPVSDDPLVTKARLARAEGSRRVGLYFLRKMEAQRERVREDAKGSGVKIADNIQLQVQEHIEADLEAMKL